MGFFSSKNTETNEDGTCDCRLCGLPLSSTNFSGDIGLCDGCLIQTNSFLNNYFTPRINKFETLAKNETDPKAKIKYLREILDVLYDYKVKYFDNDIDFIDGDIDDMIDSIIDRISMVRM